MWYLDDPHGAFKSSVTQLLCLMDRAENLVWEDRVIKSMDPSGMELGVTVLGQQP